MGLNPFRRHSSSPRLEKLRALSLFGELATSELAIVEALLHERDFLKDEVIFDEGEDGQAIYIVLDGAVLICRQGEPESGLLATLEAGSFFGDIALLENLPRTAQARAAENCRLAVFFRADFVGLMETHGVIASKISLQLARNMGKRLRDATLGVGSVHRHL
ncbi:MAG: cyclic nucleotide-binding domain-containing protein [Rhodocyclaceae bacterium]|nr:cyclic nucleotide-binding domain-containing protein [Rhodocyclaceae bacterium]